jgi:hypothetical protein
MLTQVITAYPYQEYSDDDDVRAFFTGFNQAAQLYVDWFANTVLAYYPGLSGELLDWVGEGLYGQPRSGSLAVQGGGTLGPLNTLPLNTQPLNYFSFPTSTYYTLTDDIYQRVLTWNLYKGDGRRFSMRWLKRRIARFLFGVNGIDPIPSLSDFVIGAENTTAISVQVASGTLTVDLNQALLSSQAQVTPNITQLFKLAFLGGLLELPAEYTYAVNILVNLTAFMSPSSLTKEAGTATVTSSAATMTLQGGSGNYTYAWVFQSGGAGITINSPSSASTTFTATGLASGGSDTGIALCTATDTITSQTATATVSVTLIRATAIAATISPASLTVTGSTQLITTGTATVMASGGSGTYTYTWVFSSGGFGITINSPTHSSTTFTGNLSPSTSASGTASCTVADGYGQIYTLNIPVSITRTAAPTVTISPSTLSTSGTASSATIGPAVATASGGVAPYSYRWSIASGSAFTITSPSSNSTTFSISGVAAGTSAEAIAQVAVTDANGSVVTSVVSLLVTRVTAVTATVSPISATSSGTATNQTTNAVVVTASGGSGTYTYAWRFTSGGAGLNITSPTAASTTFYGTGLTPPNDYTGSATCTITDAYGQTYVVSVGVSIDCAAVTDIFTGEAANTTVIPNGAAQVVIEGWGPGGQGGAAHGSICDPVLGAGGGAGGYFRKTINLTSANWGKSIDVSATTGSDTVGYTAVSSGTFSLATLTAYQGTAAAQNVPGAGGTATGGDVNLAGGPGLAPSGSPGAGGTPVTGVNGGPFGQGGQGARVIGGIAPFGSAGGVVFYYSPTVSPSGPSASISPSSLSTTGAAAVLTTGTAICHVAGGVAPYTYAWSWLSGGGGIVINSPSASSTSFSSSNLAAGGAVSGTAECLVTDTTGAQISTTTSVAINRVSLVTASISPSTATSTGPGASQTTGVVTVTPAGGSGAYTYSWSFTAGGSNLTINSSSAATTSFTGNGLVSPNVYTGTARCVVTDGYGQTASVTASVSISCVSDLHTYTGQAAATDVIPSGVTQVVIEGWGSGGPGGAGAGSLCHPIPGAGGGAGGYFRKTIALNSSAWGKTLSISATTGNDTVGVTQVSSGTFAIGTLTASQGNAASGSTPGTGGTATGGDVNTTGGAGQVSNGSSGGVGGTPVTGVNGGPYGGGGRGALRSGGLAGLGNAGGVVLLYT